MKRLTYPFSAIVGQHEMKLALLLGAVDWRVGVLLRGDKGSGKTTAARGLAALLPIPSPFINLPIGVTEERLIGGLHLERAMKGDPVLKPGLLSEANGGVLYIDEVNLLPSHLGDALLDTAASGINIVERDGLSASQQAEFVLLGSMNPEEGSLRPQLLDRFALSVTVSASFDPAERQSIIERRLSFERNPDGFTSEWTSEEAKLQSSIVAAREALKDVHCSFEMRTHISTVVCERAISSLRADIALLRASIAYAALERDASVEVRHIEAVSDLALAHRTRNNQRPAPQPPSPQKPQLRDTPSPKNESLEAPERVFRPRPIEAPALQLVDAVASVNGSAPTTAAHRGPATGSRAAEDPKELDIHATLIHSLLDTGAVQASVASLHERIRQPSAGTRYLFVIDSSGSHAVRERMRSVKGAAVSLLTRSFKRGDDIAIIVFRGTAAVTTLEPSSNLADAIAAFEYLPTGGRTPLAHGLELAKFYVNSNTVLIVMTDGRANFPLHGTDPWEDAMAAAAKLTCPAIVVDTEAPDHSIGQSKRLAEALNARHVSLLKLETLNDLTVTLARI